GEGRAEGDVAKDAEWRNRMLQLDEQQPVEQSASVLRRNQCCLPRRAIQVSSAFSSFTPREAFNKTTSPSRASRASHSPASSGAAPNSARVPAWPPPLAHRLRQPAPPEQHIIFFPPDMLPRPPVHLFARRPQLQH